VAENTPFAGGYIGINSFGFGGSNTHVLLRSNAKSPMTADTVPVPASIPTVLCYAARTELGVTTALDEAEAHLNNAYFYKLLLDTSNQPTNLCPFRGFTIMNRRDQQAPYRDTIVSIVV
jgi:fatty acid synthase